VYKIPRNIYNSKILADAAALTKRNPSVSTYSYFWYLCFRVTKTTHVACMSDDTAKYGLYMAENSSSISSFHLLVISTAMDITLFNLKDDDEHIVGSHIPAVERLA
jgi:hypothetical protein